MKFTDNFQEFKYPVELVESCSPRVSAWPGRSTGRHAAFSSRTIKAGAQDLSQHSATYTLFYCASGTVHVQTHSGLWLATRDRAVWLPPAFGHTVSAAFPAQLKSIQVVVESHDSVLSRCGAADMTPLVKRILERIEANATNGEAVSTDMIQLLANEIGGAFTNTLSVPLPRSQLLLDLCAYVAKNLAGDLRHQTLASAMGTSIRHLQLLFLNECGISIGDWIRQWKLIQAVVNIESGQPLGVVAGFAGYNNTSAFCAMFRRALGVSPGHYAP